MSRAHDHHQPCPCGEELADECPRCAATNPFGSMQVTHRHPTPPATDVRAAREAIDTKEQP